MKFLSNHYGDLYFPPATVEKMKALGLTDKDMYDVYLNGDTRQTPEGGHYMVRNYNGYEIGFFYIDRGNHEYAVIGVWKRERR